MQVQRGQTEAREPTLNRSPTLKCEAGLSGAVITAPKLGRRPLELRKNYEILSSKNSVASLAARGSRDFRRASGRTVPGCRVYRCRVVGLWRRGFRV